MTPNGLERRTILRSWLATGVALCLPTLHGCGDKKPASPETSPMSGGDTPPPPTVSETAPPTGDPGMAAQPGASGSTGETGGSKLAQAAVKYQDRPKGSESCANCMHFLPESNTCQLVEGKISPQGWCSIWAAKAT